MVILVTGASGFVGCNLARKLVALGHEVRTTRREGEQPAVPGTISLGTSFSSLNNEQSWLEGVEAVFHQAADNDPQSKDLLGVYRTNVVGTATLFEDLYEAGCRKFIYASSTAVYGSEKTPYVEDRTPVRPLTSYAYSKAAVEEYAHAFHRLRPDAKFAGLRYCNVYGPGEQHKRYRASMIYQIIKKMKEGISPRLFKFGEQMRDWIHVEDVVQANVRALEAANYDDEIFNIGSGGCTSFRQLVQMINQILGINIEPEYINNPFKGTYQDITLCDITKARDVLGFEPEFGSFNGLKHYLENWS